jgi:hypothetical protein
MLTTKVVPAKIIRISWISGLLYIKFSFLLQEFWNLATKIIRSFVHSIFLKKITQYQNVSAPTTVGGGPNVTTEKRRHFQDMISPMCSSDAQEIAT